MGGIAFLFVTAVAFRNMKHLFILRVSTQSSSRCVARVFSSVPAAALDNGTAGTRLCAGGNAKSTEFSRAVPEDCVGRGSRSSTTTVTAAEEQPLCVTPKDCQALTLTAWKP